MIPGHGAKIPHASQPKNQNIRQKQYSNKFNKDFKNGPHQKSYMHPYFTVALFTIAKIMEST